MDFQTVLEQRNRSEEMLLEQLYRFMRHYEAIVQGSSFPFKIFKSFKKFIENINHFTVTAEPLCLKTTNYLFPEGTGFYLNTFTLSRGDGDAGVDCKQSIFISYKAINFYDVDELYDYLIELEHKFKDKVFDESTLEYTKSNSIELHEIHPNSKLIERFREILDLGDNVRIGFNV